MWGVLQSSYDDVEAELNVLRNRHKDKFILFVGGDGLSIMRINHLLLKYPDLYIDSAPMVIPVQGEAPHAAPQRRDEPREGELGAAGLFGQARAAQPEGGRRRADERV